MEDLTQNLILGHPIASYFALAVLIASTLGWVWWAFRKLHSGSPASWPNVQVPPLPLRFSDYLLLVILVMLLFTGLPLPLFDLFLVVVALLLWKLRTNSLWTYLHLNSNQVIKTLATGVSVALAIYLPLELLAGVLEKVARHFGEMPPIQPAVELFLRAHGLAQLLPLILLATVAAPMGEEFLFRGLLYTGLKSHLPTWAAMLISGFLFAALHQHLVSFLPLWILGILLCQVMELTGSIWTGLLIHAFFNGLTAALLLAARAAAIVPTPS